MLGRSQFEPIQMPVCMELGRSVYLEALVSINELRKHFNTESSRRLLSCVNAIYWVLAWYVALNRMLFSIWAVSASSNFSVANLATKQSTQRAIFLFCSNLSIRVWFICLPFNSPVAFGCIWAFFVSLWWLCYKTSKSRLSDSDSTIQRWRCKEAAMFLGLVCRISC